MEHVEIPLQTTRQGCCADLSGQQMTTAEAERTSADLQILAHPVRLQILDLLASHPGQVCVCDLESALPVKQPTVSHHLRLLREAGLIDCERHGQWAYYFLQQPAVTALRDRLAAQLARFS